MKSRWMIVTGLIALFTIPRTGVAQGHGPKKEFAVAPSHAVSVTRDVLVHQGYEVIRIETVGKDQVVYYRRGNMGKGKGKGPPLKMVIRHVENRVLFVDTPDAILVDINVRLHL